MLHDKLKSLTELLEIRQNLKKQLKKVVFTNGVFDLLHRGHVEYLAHARELGDSLFLGLNSDISVRKIKGPGKPLVKEDDRAIVLAGLTAVDYICFFNEDTPQEIIETLVPDILVKGGDYQIDKIVGKEIVEKNGGKVVTIPLVNGFSTTELTKKIAHMTTQKESIE
jgi:D-beta-D-heptose 7-phosphate kinase/D-beta-D-heptose 1-phosphate adenosyltransferase